MMGAHADDLIARALSGPTTWPADMDADLVAGRAIYHGVTGLLIARAAHIAAWPEVLHTKLRAEAVAQTMWEIRHRAVLLSLLAALVQSGVDTVLLKGTALAYGLYPAPTQRSRGDTDLLVAPKDLERARTVMAAQGFVCEKSLSEAAEPERAENWVMQIPGGGHHEIDLHVDVFSSPALATVLDCATAQNVAVGLPQLSPEARALPLSLALMQACLHRAQHVVSPYLVDGQRHYGGDRLIWLMDVDLAMRALTSHEQSRFVTAATRGGVGPLCAATLRSAAALLGTPCPPDVIAALDRGPVGPASRYLAQNRAIGRVFEDIRALPGLRNRLRHAGRRLFPPEAAMRSRYPDLANAPLPYLHLRRIAGIWRRHKADKK